MSPKSTSPLTAVSVQILVSLAGGPRHGYGIKLDIEERTESAIIVGSGTLYQALQRLEREGLIAETAENPTEDSRRGRAYQLLPSGREALDRELAVMRRTLSTTAALAVPGAGKAK